MFFAPLCFSRLYQFEKAAEIQLITMSTNSQLNMPSKDVVRNARQNQIDKVEYKLVRPTAKDNQSELAKTTFITKIDDIVCGVGYYSK